MEKAYFETEGERKKSHAQEREGLRLKIERLPRRLKTAVNPLLIALSLFSPNPSPPIVILH